MTLFIMPVEAARFSDGKSRAEKQKLVSLHLIHLLRVFLKHETLEDCNEYPHLFHSQNQDFVMSNPNVPCSFS